MQSTDAISEEWIVIQNTLGLKPVSKNYSLFQIISLMLVTIICLHYTVFHKWRMFLLQFKISCVFLGWFQRGPDVTY